MHAKLRGVRSVVKGVVRQTQLASSKAVPKRVVEEYVYGRPPLDVVAKDTPGQAAAVWQNLDGHRIEDGRYARFVELIEKDGIPSSRIYTDPLRTHAYGTDASFYRLNPKVVVRAVTEQEVITLLHRAQQCHTPVTFRAAGTSLSGQAITDSVLIKISHCNQHWRSYSIKEEGEVVTLQPGLIGGEVNRILERHAAKHSLPQRKLGPDPASIDSCMIGGIFNNNSSGMCCGVSQNTYHSVQDCRVVLYDGTVLDTGDAASVASFKISHATLLAQITDIARRVQTDARLAETITRKFKIKCTTGYSINAFVDFAPENPIEILKHILVGSEGTLAFLSELTMRTVPEHPFRASAFMMFETTRDACEATKVMKKLDLVNAAELFDRASLRRGEESEDFATAVHGVRGCPESAAGILTEVRAATQAELDSKIDTLLATFEDKGIRFLPTDVPNSFHTDPKKFNIFWDMRKGLIPKVGGARPKGSVMLIEDVACPIDALADMTLDLRDMFLRHKYDGACVFGHALDGNLHLVFTQSFDTEADIQQFDEMMQDMADIVSKKHSGSLKGEHGTGRNVASFVEMEWGEKAFDVMWEIKALFDPLNLLNPGVLLSRDADLHVKSLKVLPVCSDIVDKCIECGFCESNCPSKDLSLTPRQRIAAYREMARLKTAVPSGVHTAKYNEDRLRQMEGQWSYLAEETCAADGMCQEKCPVSINTGDLIKTLRASPSRGVDGHPVFTRVAQQFSRFELVTRVLLRTASLFRAFLGDRSLALSINSIKGLAGRFGSYVPIWHPFMPRASSAAGVLQRYSGVAAADNTVVFMPSCVNRMMSPREGDNAISLLIVLLERAGYSVVVPQEAGLCCGMLFDSRGCATSAALKGAESVAVLEKASRGFTLPVVCETSPCTKAFHDAGAVIYDPVTFLHLAAKRLTFKQVEETIVIHVPCSSKKLGATYAFAELAKRCAVNVVESGVPCCGTAGDRGMRYPELPAASMQHLAPEATETGVACYSSSLTCEMGLSNVTDKQWQSLLALVERATRG